MSCHRNNSVREKVTGKKWIYLERERDTPQTECGPSQKVRVTWLVFFDGVISQVSDQKDYSNYWDKWKRFPGIGPVPTFIGGFGTVMVLMGVSFSIC